MHKTEFEQKSVFLYYRENIDTYVAGLQRKQGGRVMNWLHPKKWFHVQLGFNIVSLCS